MNYYPEPREWQFRDEYPVDDSHNLLLEMTPNEWGSVDENYNFYSETQVKTPEEFKKEVELLRTKYNLDSADLWNKENSAKH